ncbi:hypothetical protein BKA69DRAFT_286669 [Paraphysoderma sedebokerense]|nr:hypothetical protein BKA69DRAFT_286669 [Paraphysoderma sedebokerense]
MLANAHQPNNPHTQNGQKSVRFRLPEVEVVVPVRERTVGNLKVAINSIEKANIPAEDGATTPPTTSEDTHNHQPDRQYYTSNDLLIETPEEMASRLHPLQQARYYSLKRIAELTASCRSQGATDATPKIVNKSKRIRQPKLATSPHECRRSERFRQQIVDSIQPISDTNEELVTCQDAIGVGSAKLYQSKEVVKSSITGLLIHNGVVYTSDKIGCISAWNISNGCSLLKQTQSAIHSLAPSWPSGMVGLYTEPSKPSGGLLSIDAQNLDLTFRPLCVNPTAIYANDTDVWAGTADGRAVFVDLRSQGGFSSELTLQSFGAKNITSGIQSIGKIGNVLAFSFGSKIALVDSRTNKAIDAFDWENGPGDLSFHSSLQYGLVTGEAGSIGVWADIGVSEKWKPPSCFKHNIRRNARPVWHPKLPIFYAPSNRKCVDILSPTGKLLGTIENGNVPTRLAISSDGLYLGLSTIRGTVTLWTADV